MSSSVGRPSSRPPRILPLVRGSVIACLSERNAWHAAAVPRYGARMETRKFGRTGLNISVLTFGCGAVGGLMTRGAPADQERAVARALEAGVNHFDTAAAYGAGASEQNVGRV